MREATTEVRKHGSKKFETLFNSDVSLVDQQAAIQKMRGSPVHEKYAEVRYYESPRKSTFSSPEEAEARKEAREKAAKEAESKSKQGSIDAEKAKAKTAAKAA